MTAISNRSECICTLDQKLSVIHNLAIDTVEGVESSRAVALRVESTEDLKVMSSSGQKVCPLLGESIKTMFLQILLFRPESVNDLVWGDSLDIPSSVRICTIIKHDSESRLKHTMHGVVADCSSQSTTCSLLPLADDHRLQVVPLLRL